MAATYTIKQGHTDPLTATLKDRNGAVDLTGATVVLEMQNSEGTQIVDGGSVTIVDAASGQVSYAWAAGETDVVGEYEAEFHVTDAGSDVKIFPSKSYINVIILEDRA